MLDDWWSDLKLVGTIGRLVEYDTAWVTIDRYTSQHVTEYTGLSVEGAVGGERGP